MARNGEIRRRRPIERARSGFRQFGFSNNEATNPESQCAGYAVIRINQRRRASYERSWPHV